MGQWLCGFVLPVWRGDELPLGKKWQGGFARYIGKHIYVARGQGMRREFAEGKKMPLEIPNDPL